MTFKVIDLKPLYGIKRCLAVDEDADWMALARNGHTCTVFKTTPSGLGARPMYSELAGQFITEATSSVTMNSPEYQHDRMSLRFIGDCPDIRWIPDSNLNSPIRGGVPSDPHHDYMVVLDLEPLYGIKEKKNIPGLDYKWCTLEHPNTLWLHKDAPIYRPELHGWRCGGVGEHDYKSISVSISATVGYAMSGNSLRHIDGLQSNVPEVTSDVKATLPDIECVPLPNSGFDYDPVDVIDYVRKQAEVYTMAEVCAYLRELTALGKLLWVETESTDSQRFHFVTVGRDLSAIGLTVTSTVGGDVVLTVDSVRHEVKDDSFIDFITCAAITYRRVLDRHIPAISIVPLMDLTSENKCTWINVNNDVLVSDIPGYGVCILDISSSKCSTLYVCGQSVTVTHGSRADDLSLLRRTVVKQLNDAATKQEGMRDRDKAIIGNLVTLTKGGSCKWALSDSRYVGVALNTVFYLDTTDMLSLKLSTAQSDIVECYESCSNARVVGFDYGLLVLCKLVMSPEVTLREEVCDSTATDTSAEMLFMEELIQRTVFGDLKWSCVNNCYSTLLTGNEYPVAVTLDNSKPGYISITAGDLRVTEAIDGSGCKLFLRSGARALTALLNVVSKRAQVV